MIHRPAVMLWLLFIAVVASGETVTVSGRVTLSGSTAGMQPSQLHGVVAWLTPVGAQTGTTFAPRQALRLTQHNKSFEPHLLVVPVGAKVEFPNHDPFFHNVFSLFEGKKFDLGLYEAGSTRTYTLSLHDALPI